MSQPQAYARIFSFTNDQTANPSTKTPGNQLDAEFNAVLITLTQTLANLALIQRDDGQLANGSVGAAQLSPSVQTGVTPATLWTSPANYQVNNTVFFGPQLYRCLVAHISGVFATDLANGNWVLIGDFTAPTFSPSAPNTVMGNATGVTATPTAVAPATARSSALLNVESFTGHGDSNYTILATDRVVGTNAALTASRTWTLPAANSVNPGQPLIVADFQGTVTGVNTLVIARAGADTVNGGTSVTINNANGVYILWSDGVSKWTAIAGNAAPTGVTSIAALTGALGLGTGLTTSGSNLVLNATTVTNTLGADVALNNTANYFDGPSCAQGTQGTWFAMGQITVTTAAADTILWKLWDGTTVIASGVQTVNNGFATITFSGKITSPAGNIKISVKDNTNITGSIRFNASLNGADSTLTVVRIA